MEEQNACNYRNIAFREGMKAYFRTASQDAKDEREYNAHTFDCKNCIILDQPLLLAYI